MADLVNLDDMRPHTAQEIVCIECVKRWVAVAPGGEPLPQYECPECGGPGLPVGKAIDNMPKFASLDEDARLINMILRTTNRDLTAEFRESTAEYIERQQKQIEYAKKLVNLFKAMFQDAQSALEQGEQE